MVSVVEPGVEEVFVFLFSPSRLYRRVMEGHSWSGVGVEVAGAVYSQTVTHINMAEAVSVIDTRLRFVVDVGGNGGSHD